MMDEKELRFPTEPVLKNVWLNLQTDFATTLQDPDFMADERRIIMNWNTAGIREIEPVVCYRSSKARFKRRVQLNNLFKRVVFERDKYTHEQLEEMTREKFVATQKRICEHEWKPIPLRSKIVLRKARLIIKEILGSFSHSELLERFEFGKKAAAGLRKDYSYLDTRIGSTITGTSPHISFFKQYLIHDPLLDRVFDSCVPMALDRYEEYDSLNLVYVPKSWKIYRGIMPNTIAGGCYTLALGRMIEERLRDIGLDISALPDFHKILASLASVTRVLTTADLTSASDSITWSLLCMLLPRAWLRAIAAGRISQFTTSNRRYYMHTFCTMGIGFTFPLQTLLYYALLKAIQELVSASGRISVFGDDLIYPTKMHGYVSRVFTDLGFILNQDKTFVQEFFRESCGGDYYHGTDVRPYMPEHQACELTPTRYLAFLYKTINGLLTRWDECEIPNTLEYLQNRVLQVSGTLLQVPPNFPDTSGIRVLVPRKSTTYPWSPVKRRTDALPLESPEKGSGVGDYIFTHLAVRSNRRAVWWAYPYLWMALRQKREDDENFGIGYNASVQFFLDQRRLRYAYQRTMVVRNWLKGVTAAKLNTRRVKCHMWKSSCNKKKYKYREVQVCDSLDTASYETKTDSTDCWAEVLRN